MSQQANFFMDTMDLEHFCSWMTHHFGNLGMIQCNEAGRIESNTILPALPDIRMVTSTAYLVPQWAYEDVQFIATSNCFYAMDDTLSPVIEYTPCRIDDSINTVSSGRIYWSFEGILQTGPSRQVRGLFSWMRKHSIPTSLDRRFRVFKSACDNKRLLDFGFGIVVRAPEWKL